VIIQIQKVRPRDKPLVTGERLARNANENNIPLFVKLLCRVFMCLKLKS
jgi:hypothetical protein